jgi:hypothetical protein
MEDLMKKTRGTDGRTDMERRFIVEYLVDFNATRAYIAAAAPRKITQIGRAHV